MSRTTANKKHGTISRSNGADAPAPGNEGTHELYMMLEEVDGKLFSDQTGPFSRTSNRGRKCVVVFYVFDKNVIKLVTIKNRTQGELMRAYKEVYDYLTMRGHKPRLHKLDN